MAQANARVASFAIGDTAANVAANLIALNSATKLTAIALTDTTVLALSYAVWSQSSSVLNKITGGAQAIVTGVPAALAATVQASGLVRAFAVSDSGAAIGAVLDQLNAAEKLTFIGLTTTAPLAITASQLAFDTVALSKLPSGTLFMVSAATAGAAAAMQANARVAGFGVSDSSANLTANWASLIAAAKLRSVALANATPLALTAAQFAAGTALLGKLTATYTLAIGQVSVSGAAAMQAQSHVASFGVADSAANVAAGLDALNLCGKLTTIGLSDSGPLAVAYPRFIADIGVLAKISGTWAMTVSGVTAAGAAQVQASAHATGFAIADTAAAVGFYLAALGADGKLTSIALTGGTSISVAYAALTAGASVLGKIGGAYTVTVTGATVAQLAAARAVSHATSVQITDTAANVVAGLAALNGDSMVGSITLSGGTALTVTYAQMAAYGGVLRKLAAVDQVSVTGVGAASAGFVQANGYVASFNVTDTAANVAANLDALNGDTRLSAIALSDASPLILSAAKLAADTVALGKLTGAFTLTVTGVTATGAAAVAANSRVGHFSVSDTLANIGAKLDQLEANVKAGKLTAIAVSDRGQTLTLSPMQYAADKDAIALLQGSYTVNQTVAPVSGATINLVWDASALAAPAAFRAAVTYTAHYFQSLIANPITVNLAVGYGEVGGSALGGGVLGAAGPDQGIGRSYAQYKADLAAHVSSPTMQTIVNNMSATDPTNGRQVWVTSAEAKALGIWTGGNTGIDGSMGFAADPNGTVYTYDPNARGVSGKYDLIGIVEHELTHALGRIALGGNYGSWVGALDLFRYSAPGVHSPYAGGSAYFSIDGGKSNLDWFSSSSDLGDWASTAGNDANIAYANSGVVNQFTQTDIAELNALGFATGSAPSASSGPQIAVTASAGLSAPSLAFLGTPSLAFADGEIATILADLAPATGIEEIARFTYGINTLNIDMHGVAAAAFVAFDTSVDGRHAIALAGAADTTHGIVLLGLPANSTAADLMANHLTFSGGHAIVR